MSTIYELRTLPFNWDDDGGAPISQELADIVTSLFDQLINSGIAVPGLFPVGDGSVDVIWQDLGIYCTIDETDFRLTFKTRQGRFITIYRVVTPESQAGIWDLLIRYVQAK